MVVVFRFLPSLQPPRSLLGTSPRKGPLTRVHHVAISHVNPLD